jgi:hypothetical protein
MSQPFGALAEKELDTGKKSQVKAIATSADTSLHCYHVTEARGVAMETKAVRIPLDTYLNARTLSAITGETPGLLLSRAFEEFMQNHRDQFVRTFQYAQKYVASGDLDGLADMLSEGINARVAAAVQRLSVPDSEESS